MNKEFTELKEEYQKAKNEQDSQKQRDCLKKMSENIEKRGGSAEINCYEMESDRIYEKLLAIDGEINQKESENKRKKTADIARRELLSQNIYGSDHQYPQSV